MMTKMMGYRKTNQMSRAWRSNQFRSKLSGFLDEPRNLYGVTFFSVFDSTQAIVARLDLG